MRRGRTFFNSLAAASFVIFLAGVALWIASSFRDVRVEFRWWGARWEAAYRWGFLSLNNAPQRRAEEEEYDATRSAFVHGLGWGTADYRRALARLHQWEARPSAPATPEIDHRLRPWKLMAGLPLLPGIWLARRPAQRRRVFCQAARAVTLLLCLCFVGTGFLWARSYRATDVVTLAPYRLYRAVSGRGGVFLESLRVERMERTVEVPQTRQLQIIPRSDYVCSPLDYAQLERDESEYAAFRKPARVEPRRWKSGRWQWGAFPPADYRSTSRMAWTQPGHAALPGITPVLISRSGRITGIIGADPIRRQIQDQIVGRALWLPYWLLLLPTSVGPVLLFRKNAAWRRRTKRSKLNLCLTCGYDLRGTPGRCPECGTVTSTGGAEFAGAGG